VVEVSGELVGWVQYEEEPYARYPSVALDIALTTGLHGRGYGRRALRLAVEHFVARGHHRFTIDPDVRRERAIRSYAPVAFKPVGVLRSYRRKPGGGWGDGLLMDFDSCLTGSGVRRPRARSAVRRRRSLAKLRSQRVSRPTAA
jgi:aminoglycoside 6'-N-acetyltransferase